jgi:hypothetical protein
MAFPGLTARSKPARIQRQDAPPASLRQRTEKRKDDGEYVEVVGKAPSAPDLENDVADLRLDSREFRREDEY